jgi:hypothetical protein
MCGRNEKEAERFVTPGQTLGGARIVTIELLRYPHGSTSANGNRVLPHSAFRGQTPDEMYFGTGDAVPTDLTARAAAARRTRGEANRSASCATCPSVGAVARVDGQNRVRVQPRSAVAALAA